MMKHKREMLNVRADAKYGDMSSTESVYNRGYTSAHIT